MTEPTPLYKLTDALAPPSPVLVVALEGWVDAGLAGESAMTTLLEAIDTRVYAVFDSEELLDQRARRPKLKVVDGINEDLDWPELMVRVGTDPVGAGIALLSGPEPDMRWRGFASDVADLALALEVRLVVGLGGFPAGAPHAARSSLRRPPRTKSSPPRSVSSQGASRSRLGSRPLSSGPARAGGSRRSACGRACRTT